MAAALLRCLTARIRSHESGYSAAMNGRVVWLSQGPGWNNPDRRDIKNAGTQYVPDAGFLFFKVVSQVRPDE
jgi:hypothetical protein